MIHLDLQPEIEAQLAAEASARGLAVDRYVETIVATRASVDSRTVQDAIDRILKLRESTDLNGIHPKDLIEAGRKY